MSTLTAIKLSEYVGHEVMFYVPNSPFRIRGRVLDVRAESGALRFEVEPLFGSGQMWVAESRVQFDADATAQATAALG